MLRKCSLRLLLVLVFLVPALVLATGSGRADDRDHERNRGAVRLLKTIPIPVNPAAVPPVVPLVAFDISWVDPDTQLYYLADRSNKAIDVIDAKHGTFVRQIHGNPGPFKGFTGNNDTSGPNGVVVSGHFLFVTDAPSRVVTIDLRTDQIVSDVSTGGGVDRATGLGLRTDELAYDPRDGIILAVNNADNPPFATLINVNTQNGHLTLGPKITFMDATNGAEQPVWEPKSRRFYISIPEVNGVTSDGAVKKINPHTGAVEATFLVKFCQPAGLTVGPKQDLLLGCSVVFNSNPAGAEPWTGLTDPFTAAPTQVIMDAKTGEIDKVVAGVGGSDEVWFNRGDGLYYTASRANPGAVPNGANPQTSPVLGVIDAESQTLIQVVPTFNTPNPTLPAPRGTAHSVAVNPHNNHVFVPLPKNNVFPDCLGGCIAVFGTPRGEHEDEH